MPSIVVLLTVRSNTDVRKCLCISYNPWHMLVFMQLKLKFNVGALFFLISMVEELSQLTKHEWACCNRNQGLTVVVLELLIVKGDGCGSIDLQKEIFPNKFPIFRKLFSNLPSQEEVCIDCNYP